METGKERDLGVELLFIMFTEKEMHTNNTVKSRVYRYNFHWEHIFQ